MYYKQDREQFEGKKSAQIVYKVFVHTKLHTNACWMSAPTDQINTSIF